LALGLVVNSQAKTNREIAANRLIERYPKTHIKPSMALAVFHTESGEGHNDGRYYGNMSSRIYDIEDSTDQFLALMKKYGNVAKQDSWIGQIYAMQGHGYYGGSDNYYINYLINVVERFGFEKYDKKAEKYEKKLKKLNREQLQQEPFILYYDPTLLPWQCVTYKKVIKGGTIRIEDNWLDVVYTVPGKKNIIYTGDLLQVMKCSMVYLEEVCEEVVG
jgi:hypothetical protein